jgi:hypothetical protein
MAGRLVFPVRWLRAAVLTRRGRPRGWGRSGRSRTLLVALRYVDNRPFHLVPRPVFIGRVNQFRLIDDACLNPRVFRLVWMQCEYRRTTSRAKPALYFAAASTCTIVTPHFRGRADLQILSVNTDANIECAPIRFPTIFAVAIIRGAEVANVIQSDTSTQARRFKLPIHDLIFRLACQHLTVFRFLPTLPRSCALRM